MRVCTLHGIEGADVELVGTVFLDNGTISATYTPGHELEVTRTLDRPNVPASRDRAISPQEDPEAWFDALPSMYHGTYFWATMRDDILPEEADGYDFASIMKKDKSE